MKFYRYYLQQYAETEHSIFPQTKLILDEFNLMKETAKGYWICQGDPNRLHGFKKWVSKTAKKRYAYPSKKDALVNYQKRTERRIAILKAQIAI